MRSTRRCAAYCTYSFEGEEYGESTYIYEFRTIAIDSYPKPTEENITEDQVIEHDLTAGEVIGFSIFVSDVDDDSDELLSLFAGPAHLPHGRHY